MEHPYQIRRGGAVIVTGPIFTLANEFIEFQCNDTAHAILLEYELANHQLVLLSIANPVVVVAVLVATSWIDRS